MCGIRPSRRLRCCSSNMASYSKMVEGALFGFVICTSPHINERRKLWQPTTTCRETGDCQLCPDDISTKHVDVSADGLTICLHACAGTTYWCLRHPLSTVISVTSSGIDAKRLLFGRRCPERVNLLRHETNMQLCQWGQHHPLRHHDRDSPTLMADSR